MSGANYLCPVWTPERTDAFWPVIRANNNGRDAIRKAHAATPEDVCLSAAHIVADGGLPVVGSAPSPCPTAIRSPSGIMMKPPHTMSQTTVLESDGLHRSLRAGNKGGTHALRIIGEMAIVSNVLRLLIGNEIDRDEGGESIADALEGYMIEGAVKAIAPPLVISGIAWGVQLLSRRTFAADTGKYLTGPCAS